MSVERGEIESSKYIEKDIQQTSHDSKFAEQNAGFSRDFKSLMNLQKETKQKNSKIDEGFV